MQKVGPKLSWDKEGQQSKSMTMQMKCLRKHPREDDVYVSYETGAGQTDKEGPSGTGNRTGEDAEHETHMPAWLCREKLLEKRGYKSHQAQR